VLESVGLRAAAPAPHRHCQREHIAPADQDLWKAQLNARLDHERHCDACATLLCQLVGR
jgi:hypothetical protein